MKLRYFLIPLAIFLASSLSAQTADDLNEGTVVTHDEANAPTPYSFKWWGRNGFYYFIEQSETLKEWTYFPYAVIGSDGVEGVDFDTNSDRLFLRLRFTNDTNSPLLTSDFDGDNVLNIDEFQLGTDVFSWLSSDGDLMADDWELFHFGDLDELDATNDDGDFTTNLEESELGLDPSIDERGSALTYTYDPVGRLTQASSDEVTITYTMDEEGNILTKN